MESIMSIVTMLITWILGIVSKRVPFIKNNLIPIQNILIGVVMAIINWIITKDFSTAIAISGLTAGGMYDVVSNLSKMRGE